MSTKIYRDILKNRGFVKVVDFFSDVEKRAVLGYFNEIEEFKEEKNKYMIYYEQNKQKSRIEYFYKYHNGVKKLVNETLKPFLGEVLEKDQLLFKDKMNWKHSNGKGFKAHQDHLAWNDFDISIFHSIALSGNISNKENGCLQFSNYNKTCLNQGDNLGEIDDKLENKLNWEYIETNPSDLVIFNSFVAHKSDKNDSDNSRRIMYFTFNGEEDGDLYEEYNKNKRLYFPPDIERTKKYNNKNNKNNKYNLANPII